MDGTETCMWCKYSAQSNTHFPLWIILSHRDFAPSRDEVISCLVSRTPCTLYDISILVISILDFSFLFLIFPFSRSGSPRPQHQGVLLWRGAMCYQYQLGHNCWRGVYVLWLNHAAAPLSTQRDLFEITIQCLFVLYVGCAEIEPGSAYHRWE